jgi:hypothetical protein
MAGLFISLSSKITTTVVVNATTGATAPASLVYAPQGGMIWLAALAGLMPSIMLGIIYLLFGTIFAHFAFKLAGGVGGKGKTLSIIGYSMTPVILVRLLSILIALATVPGYPGVLSPAELATFTPDIVAWAYSSGVWYITDIMTTGAFIWTGYLLIFGIREAHGTSTLWATVIAIACIIILGWTFWQAH